MRFGMNGASNTMMVPVWRVLPTPYEFEASFEAATGLAAPAGAAAFGDPGTQANELARLISAGRKRATAGMLDDYLAAGEALPKSGDLLLVLDGDDEPVCVIRTTSVEVVPFCSVAAAVAYEEGEGDRSLTYWRDEHERFLTARCQALGIDWDEGREIVCERFELVWPSP